jgi:tetratricopeptide (TPR) repeat protein
MYGIEYLEFNNDLSDLSGVLSDLGEYEAAKEGYEKILEIDKKHFGEDHI